MFFECLILINQLINNDIIKKERIRTTGAKAAPALACH
ncbi:hypothetical protein yrohd0001_36060 [Yersinia rohdei ATCC 43380]|nr:hypothetical protein yrohd0001_36060 [Yersinia rohdei ATCC 43380]